MELKKEIESLLFSSGKVMKEQELVDLTNYPLHEVQEALAALKKDYDERDTSLFLMNTGDNWKLNVREKYLGLVTKIVADTELPFPILETLGVIAYKAPAMQADIVKARGTNAYEQIGVLVEQGFVEKKKEGRSFRLSLTPKFFQYFEVASHEEIKEALKDVKVPEPSKPAAGKVGELEVVDLPPDAKEKGEQKGEHSEKKTLGELEVVDDMPEPAPVDVIRPDTQFLDDIDKKINDLSKRNDDFDQDAALNKEIDWKKDLGLDEEMVKEIEGEKTASEKLADPENEGFLKAEEPEETNRDEAADKKTESSDKEDAGEKTGKSRGDADEGDDKELDFEEGEEEDDNSDQEEKKEGAF
jgi:segregation and condensation protein B